MTRERIEDFREIVLPFVKKRLLETNYENLGESDAEMFAKDFDEILDLAIKALEQEPKSEWKHDHEILRAYADGANNVLDKIRAEIESDWQLKKYPSSPFSCGLRRAIEIIDKYKTESEDA